MMEIAFKVSVQMERVSPEGSKATPDFVSLQYSLFLQTSFSIVSLSWEHTSFLLPTVKTAEVPCMPGFCKH